MSSNNPARVEWWKIALPVVIGLSIVGWMIGDELTREVWANFNFNLRAVAFILLAFLFMVGRDLGYIIRVRLFARGGLSWRAAFRVIMLWEFTSAITPSAVGGTSVAVLFVHKEGLAVGRSATIVMLTAFFDELFFAIIFPLLLLFVGSNAIFGVEMGSQLMLFALIGFGVKLAFLLALSYGLFVNPHGLKWALSNIFRLPVLRRWRDGAIKAGDDIILSSAEIKHYNWSFWFKAFAATTLSWSSRYLVANALFMAFFAVGDHLLLFARQLAMWIMMLVAPTPGGSGFAEYIFSNFLGDIIPVDSSMQVGAAALIALLWRVVTYYPYLLIGAVILPRWLRTRFKVKRRKLASE